MITAPLVKDTLYTLMNDNTQHVHSHDRINFEMHNIVSRNIDSSAGREHARETLDDVIADLIQYRDSIATSDEYVKKNSL